MWKRCLQVVNISWWFLYRRWRFKSWTKAFDAEPLLGNCKKCDVARCRTYPIIHRDMKRIMIK